MLAVGGGEKKEQEPNHCGQVPSAAQHIVCGSPSVAHAVGVWWVGRARLCRGWRNLDRPRSWTRSWSSDASWCASRYCSAHAAWYSGEHYIPQSFQRAGLEGKGNEWMLGELAALHEQCSWTRCEAKFVCNGHHSQEDWSEGFTIGFSRC